MVNPNLISVAAARAAVRSATHVMPLESVSIYEALGRYLAIDVVADQAIPECPRSAMDGYALKASDLLAASSLAPIDLAVVGQAFAGTLFVGSVKTGETVRIPTGGCLPNGTDTVVPIEATSARGDGMVRFSASIELGKNVVPTGQDVVPGKRLIEKGIRLQPAHLGVLAATGNVSVWVSARPRVTVLSSGAEVCPPEVRPNTAQVRDVNQILLGSMAQAAGATVTYGGIVPDNETLLDRALRNALETSDLVVLSAGTSVGSSDYAGKVVGQLPGARTLFHGVHMRPGKPTLMAHVRGPRESFVCGLPGFPMSAAVAFLVFVAPLIKQLQGARKVSSWREPLEAILQGPYRSVLGREDYVRVGCSEPGPGPRLAYILSEGPALVSGLQNADGFVLVPAETESLHGGAAVNVLTLDL
jgi:molybdopterin molybdotransferase